MTKLTPMGNALVYSTYVGGSGNDLGFGIALDETGAAYVSGSTSSTNFPVLSPYQGVYQGGTRDGIVFKLAPAGNRVTATVTFFSPGPQPLRPDRPPALPAARAILRLEELSCALTCGN